MKNENLVENQGLSEQIDIDAISGVSTLRSVIGQLKQEKKEQVDEICYLTEYVDSLEEENQLLKDGVKAIQMAFQKAVQKPWKPIPLPRWDK